MAASKIRNRMASLREIGWVVARDINRTVGGGNAAIELMRRTFAARGWIDAPGHALIVAVSRLTPGTNVLAYCTAAGWRLRGCRGSVAALVAASAPSSIIIFVLSAAVVRLVRYRAVQAALAIGMLIACVLVLASAWALLRPYVLGHRKVRVALFVAAALALYFAGLTPVRILLLAAAAGFAIGPGREAAPQ
jgi:chromate transporter